MVFLNQIPRPGPVNMGFDFGIAGFSCGGAECGCHARGCRSPRGACRCCRNGRVRRSTQATQFPRNNEAFGYVGTRNWRRDDREQFQGWGKDGPSPDKVKKNAIKVLTRYVNSKVRKREPFWISAELNYDPRSEEMDGLGFLPFLAAIAATAAKALPVIASAATTVYTLKALNPGQPQQSGLTMDTITADVIAQLQAKGIQLPTSQTQQMITGNSLSPENQRFLLIGGLGLLAVILVTR